MPLGYNFGGLYMSIQEGRSITKLMEQIRVMKEEGLDTTDLQKMLDLELKNASIHTLKNVHP